MAVETDRNAELLRSFLKMPRRVPRPPATGGFSILLVKRGPYGPYRALYSHERHLFFELQYDLWDGRGLRRVEVPEDLQPSTIG